jgi:membrane protein
VGSGVGGCQRDEARAHRSTLLSLLFAALFRFVANAGPEWADLWRGAFVTVPLFNVGRLTIGLYLGRSTTTPSFGAAGSLVALLLWICYSAVVTFLGAESTQVSMRRRGRRLQPKRGVALAADETHRRPAG